MLGQNTANFPDYMSYSDYLSQYGIKDGMNIEVAIDCSGSMCEQSHKKLFQDLVDILETNKNCTISILCYDTEICNYRIFNYKNRQDILKYKLLNGGGTLCKPIWEFWKSNKIYPDLAMIVTDGLVSDGWGEDGFCKTLWLMIGDIHPKYLPTFGNWIIYDKFNR